MKRWLLVLCLVLGSVNAAQAAFFSDDEARKKIADLQQQVSQLQSQIQAKLDEELKQRQAVEGRVGALESQLKSQGMIDLLNQVDRLNAELGQLKGQLEVMSHDIETTQKRQRDLYTDLDGRLRKLETAPPPAPATPAATPPAAPSVEPSAAQPQQPAAQAPAAPAIDTATELKDYEAAHALFKAGKYPQAADAFENFVSVYPDSKFAPNAQYWLGYAHFSQKNYKAAIADQQKLLQRYPDNPKAPDSMYNIANSQIQLGDIDGARQTLKKLLAKYPTSDTAPLAKKRLSAIESLKSKP